MISTVAVEAIGTTRLPTSFDTLSRAKPASCRREVWNLS